MFPYLTENEYLYGVLTNLVWDYIRYRASFPANTVLAVQRELAFNVFDTPDNCRGCDFIPSEKMMAVAFRRCHQLPYFFSCGRQH
jgi:hypothetical protein